MPEGASVAIVAAVAFGGAARDLGWVSVSLPQNARQVPRSVLDRAPWWAGARFGLELGTGMRTYLTTTAPYVLAAALLLVADIHAALAIGVGFGAGRFLQPLLRYFAAEGDAWDERLAARGTLLHPAASVSASILVAGLGAWSW